MEIDENLITELARRGIVTHTFRRLSPEKKKRIYATALKLFGEYGYDGLSVDQFSHEAGISKGSFFQYFPSKSHLLEFTVILFDNFLANLLEHIKATEPSPLARERLLHLFRSLVDNPHMSRDEEKFYHFITDAVHHSAVSLEGINLEQYLHAYISEIITRGEETGEIRGDFDIDLTAHLVSLIIGALVSWQYSGKSSYQHDMGEYLISFLFDGIKGQ